MHVSEIYNGLYETLQPSRYTRRTATTDPDAMPTIVALGLAWEKHLEGCLLAAGVPASRPGEFLREEGVAFSPDLLIDNGVTRVGEIKFTRYKMPDSPEGYYDERFAKWVTQMKAYCYALKTPYGQLLALHLNGNYKSVREPTLVITDFEFTPQELEREWRLLMNHAQAKGML